MRKEFNVCGEILGFSLIRSQFAFILLAMVFFTPVMMTTHFAVSTATATSLMGTLTASVTKNFFMQIFLNPGSSFMAVMILCGLVVAPCIGLAFLIKKLYEKYCPERQ